MYTNFDTAACKKILESLELLKASKFGNEQTKKRLKKVSESINSKSVNSRDHSLFLLLSSIHNDYRLCPRSFITGPENTF